jgi:hypothetical protein
VHLFGPTVVPTSRETAFAKLKALADGATIVHHGLRRDQRRRAGTCASQAKAK